MTNVRFAVAVHILVLLSAEDEPMNSTAIAGSVNTHPVVIRRILGALQQAGLVHARAGAHGGFQLAKRPEKVSLADIFHAVEDGAAPASHHPNPSCPVGRTVKGVVTGIGKRAESAFLAALGAETLADTVREVRRKAGLPART